MSDIQALKEVIEPEILCDFLGLDYRFSGGRLYVLCPFHGDRNLGSAFITNGYFHCFSCGESMDLIELTQKVRNADFKEAVSQLGNLFGVAISYDTNDNGYFKYHLNKEEQDVLDFPKTGLSLRKIYMSSPEMYKKIVLKKAKEKRQHYKTIKNLYADRTSEDAYKIVKMYDGMEFSPKVYRDLSDEVNRRIRVCDMIIERLE